MNPLLKRLVLWQRWQELKKLIRKKNFNLIDLGCGDGSFVLLAQENDIDAWGVDKLPPKHPSDKIIVSSFENLKIERKFDAVTMYHFLEHTRSPSLIIKKAKKLLKKDGVLVIEVPLVKNLTEKFLGKNYFAYQDKSHRHFFTQKQILALLKKEGFKKIKWGFVWGEFPLTVITTSFKKNLFLIIPAIIIFLPLKILSLVGLNREIARIYAKASHF